MEIAGRRVRAQLPRRESRRAGTGRRRSAHTAPGLRAGRPLGAAVLALPGPASCPPLFPRRSASSSLKWARLGWLLEAPENTRLRWKLSDRTCISGWRFYRFLSSLSIAGRGGLQDPLRKSSSSHSTACWLALSLDCGEKFLWHFARIQTLESQFGRIHVERTWRFDQSYLKKK